MNFLATLTKHSPVEYVSKEVKSVCRFEHRIQLLFTVQRLLITEYPVNITSTEACNLQCEYLVFMDDINDNQFPIAILSLSGREKFLKEGQTYDVLISGDIVLSVQLPNLMEFEVTETGPGVKGDTVSNVFKPATLENGMEVKVPLFINLGDKVKVDTRTNEYVERVKT